MTDPSERRGRSRRRTLAGLGTLAIAGGLGWTRLRGGYDRRQAGFDPEVLPYDETYPQGDVTMFRQGLRRLGYYPDAVVPDRVEVEWSMPVNGIGHTAAKPSPRPTPDGDTVLIPSDTGMLHAVTPDGEQRWSVETGAATSLGFHGTPLIVDGTAYIGGYDGSMYAYDVETGRRVWKTSNWRLRGAIAIGSSPAYWDGVLYVVAEYNYPWQEPSGTMWALDAATGRPLWHDSRLWGMPHPSTSIDPDAERLLTGSNDGVCYAWEFPALEPAWEFQTGAEIKGTIPTYDGAAFVGSWDGHFYRLNLADGTEEWSFETGRVIMSNPGIDPGAGVVYVGSDDNRVHALDTDTGEELWSSDVGGNVIGSLTVTSGSILVGSYDTHLYAFDKRTGETRWRVEGIGHVTSEAVPDGDRIYFVERGDISGYWSDDEPVTLNERGRAYSLVRQ